MAASLGGGCEAGKRSHHWLKRKTHDRQEFVVCGYTIGEGRRAGTFGSLVLGAYRGDELEYVGNVGTGFTDDVMAGLMAKLETLRTDTPPFREVPVMPKVRRRDIVW